MNDKKWYKTWWIWVITIIVIALIVLIPIIINESYKSNRGYITVWGAEAILSYAATIISAITTVILGIVAVNQSQKANSISDRLLRLEEINATPSLCIVENKSKFVKYSEDVIHYKLVVKNISNGIIDIKKASSADFHILASDVYEQLSFGNKNFGYSTLLPNQEKQLDFTLNNRSDNGKLFDRDFILKNHCKFNFEVKVNLELGYKNTQQIYKENIKFCYVTELDVSHGIKIINQNMTRSDYDIVEKEKT